MSESEVADVFGIELEPASTPVGRAAEGPAPAPAAPALMRAPSANELPPKARPANAVHGAKPEDPAQSECRDPSPPRGGRRECDGPEPRARPRITSFLKAQFESSEKTRMALVCFSCANGRQRQNRNQDVVDSKGVPPAVGEGIRRCGSPAG